LDKQTIHNQGAETTDSLSFKVQGSSAN